jgi:hypothetical protein
VTGLETGVWWEGDLSPVTWTQTTTEVARGTDGSVCDTDTATSTFTARPVRWHWRFAEGAVQASRAPGRGGKEQSRWAAAHTYRTKDRYTLRAETVWRLDEYGLTRNVPATPREYRVVEIRSVLVGSPDAR